jgi:nucleotide-binding universal stress UspA family protein
MRHKLLVAVDGKEPTWRVADYVGQACVGGCAGVVVFHVLPALPPYIEAGESGDSSNMRDRYEAVSEEVAEKMVQAVRDRLMKPGVTAECDVEENDGNVAEQIVAAAKRHVCDTIVVGRPSRSMIDEFFRGSVVEHLLRKPVGCTVWVVE